MKDILMRIVARLFLLSVLTLSSLTHLRLSYQFRSPLPFPIEKLGILNTNLKKSILTRYHFSYLSHLSYLNCFNCFSSLSFTPSPTSAQNTSAINQFTSLSAFYKKNKNHIFSLVDINPLSMAINTAHIDRRYIRKHPN